MKTQSIKKVLFFAKNLAQLLVVLSLLFTVACSSDNSPKTFTIKYPRADERYFSEKGDFYVVGLFPQDIQAPGNILIELFRGGTASGTPVRTLESRVDDITGVTPDSAVETGYTAGRVVEYDKGATTCLEIGKAIATNVIDSPIHTFTTAQHRRA